MASMKKEEEARRAILKEYNKWAKKHPNGATMMGGFLFFRYLQNERSDLLDFRAVGDTWQIRMASRSGERLTSVLLNALHRTEMQWDQICSA